MDGYAIEARDTAAASPSAPASLRLIGEVAAGAAPDLVVTAGTAARIATGAPVPPGADAVVPVEATLPVDAAGVAGTPGRDATGPLPDRILVEASVAIGGSIRRRGDDLVAGSVLLEPGRTVTPAAIGLLAGAGVAELAVRRRPKVAILATGDEVRAPGEPLGAAGIPDANGPGLRALVIAAGAEPIALGIAPDRLEIVEDRLRAALAAGADAIVVAGGVSVGPYDVVKLAIERVGRIDLWRVAVQPGKPFAFGTAERPGGGQPALVFGLPGNPVSSAVSFELFVRPALRRLAGHAVRERPVDRAVLREPVSKAHGRRTYVRVTAERTADGAPVRDERGRVLVRLAGGQGSHVLTALAAADGLAIVPEAVDRLAAGSEVGLRWLDHDAG
jgi:molybdopterin molybdotransferase